MKGDRAGVERLLKHDDSSLRMTYVGGLEDEEVLARVARDDPDKGVRLGALSKVKDVKVLVERARLDPDESVRLFAVKRLMYREGAGLPDPHMALACELRLLLLDPVVVKAVGELNMIYSFSEDKRPYGDHYRQGRIIVEKVDVVITDSHGKPVSQRHWQPAYDPKSKETFFFPEGKGAGKDRRYGVDVDITPVIRDVLASMSTETLKEIAQKGLTVRAATEAARLLQTKQ